MIGELIAFQRDRLGFLRRAAARHGDVARFRLLTQPVVLLSRPSTARALLSGPHANVRKSPVLRQARIVLGEGLLTAEGETHRRHRRLVQPSFHRRRIEAYAATMADVAAAEADTWRAGAAVDAVAAMHRVALQIAGRTLFGADTRAQAAEVRDAVTDLLAAYPTAVLPFGAQLRRLPLPQVRRLHRGLARIDGLVAGLIAARRAGPGPGDDLLSHLLAARDEGGGGLSDAEVRDEVVTLLLAGHETTAAALAWSLHLLAAHQQTQERAAAEVRAAVGLREPALGDLETLAFTRAVVAEALRLYPPSWGIARQATRDFAVDGVRITAGEVLVASPYVLHRDGRWWVQPDRFAPERWDGADPRRPHAAYLPFGAGARMCIGESFAWTEATLVLAAVLARWTLTPTGPPPRPVASLTLRPGAGAPLLVRPRAGVA